MSKEDMMNKISFVLKDPILQMGFEVICSKLSRLEKENAELQEKIGILLSCKNCPENKGGMSPSLTSWRGCCRKTRSAMFFRPRTLESI